MHTFVHFEVLKAQYICQKLLIAKNVKNFYDTNAAITLWYR